jgi:pimeloyl-ACP methyl ester carboxylesterase
MRDGYAELGSVRLHYVEAGAGPLVVLLHGFPEFWYSWRAQIEPLAAAGFHVVAPDLRGYNVSSKPRGVRAYDLDPLAQDIRDRIHERGEQRACVAGHDWGGPHALTSALNYYRALSRQTPKGAERRIRTVHAPTRVMRARPPSATATCCPSSPSRTAATSRTWSA